jgi:hypothetical protein
MAGRTPMQTEQAWMFYALILLTLMIYCRYINALFVALKKLEVIFALSTDLLSPRVSLINA